MVKGFSQSKVKNDESFKELKKEKKGLAAFLKGKKLSYTLPGKKQLNIFGSIWCFVCVTAGPLVIMNKNLAI